MKKHHEKASDGPHITLARRSWVCICHAFIGATHRGPPAKQYAELLCTYELVAAGFAAGYGWGPPAPAQEEEEDAAPGAPDGADLVIIGFDAGFQACELQYAGWSPPAPPCTGPPSQGHVFWLTTREPRPLSEED